MTKRLLIKSMMGILRDAAKEQGVDLGNPFDTGDIRVQFIAKRA